MNVIKTLNKLEPFHEKVLVSYRSFSVNGTQIRYQIHDKTLHHIAFTDTLEMAELIVESINLKYQINQ